MNAAEKPSLTKLEIETELSRMGFVMRWQFVPFSQSRNKGEKYPSLNYTVTISRNGLEVLTTDYLMGSANAPSYKQGFTPRTIYDIDKDNREGVAYECETGRTVKSGQLIRGRVNGPSIADVMYSLVRDSDVIDHATYESWASDLGYDTDSRKGEAIYRACLEIALKLRAACGDVTLSALNDLFTDY